VETTINVSYFEQDSALPPTFLSAVPRSIVFDDICWSSLSLFFHVNGCRNPRNYPHTASNVDTVRVRVAQGAQILPPPAEIQV
jgi:hypothetical protein